MKNLLDKDITINEIPEIVKESNGVLENLLNNQEPEWIKNIRSKKGFYKRNG